MLFFVHKYFPSFKCKKNIFWNCPWATSRKLKWKTSLPQVFHIPWSLQYREHGGKAKKMYFISSWFKQNVWLKQYLTFKATSLLCSNASTTTKGRVRHLIHVSNDLLSDFTAVFTFGKAMSGPIVGQSWPLGHGFGIPALRDADLSVQKDALLIVKVIFKMTFKESFYHLKSLINSVTKLKCLSSCNSCKENQIIQHKVKIFNLYKHLTSSIEGKGIWHILKCILFIYLFLPLITFLWLQCAFGSNTMFCPPESGDPPELMSSF